MASKVDKLESNKETKSKIMFILSMLIFSTIGIFRRNMELSSSVVALYRGVIGVIFLLVVLGVKKQKVDFKIIKENLAILLVSGFALGLNWVLLFEAYKYTTIATATLCYYMSPIIVIIASHFLFNERLSKLKLLSIILALVGMTLITGFLKVDTIEIKGIAYGLSAAIFYSCIILLNKKMPEIPSYDKTIVQLLGSVIVLLVYIVVQGNISELIVKEQRELGLLVLMGILHTGLAYVLYFGAVGRLKAQTSALYSYIDPLFAIILSAMFLGEVMGVVEVVGGILILGGTVLNDVYINKETYL